MAGKDMAPYCGYIGYIELLPVISPKVALVSSVRGGKRSMTDAFESQNTTKALYKDAGGGSSAKYTKIQKAGSFVDKRSGNHGYKQELHYKSSVKVNDKFQGCTTKCETQVKFKKVTTYHNRKASAPKKSSSSGCKKTSSSSGCKKTSSSSGCKKTSSSSGYKKTSSSCGCKKISSSSGYKKTSSSSGYKKTAYYDY